MSTKIMGPCWDLEMPAPTKSVLMSIADQANDDGVCWPSVGTIARRTCLSESSVHRAIKWLAKAQLLTISERPGRSTYYTVTPVTVTPLPHRHPGGATQTPRGVPHRHPGGATQTPRTVIEPSIEPSKNRKPFELPDWIPPEPWQGWLEVRKKIKAPSTERALKLAVTTLAELREQGHEPGPVLDQSTARGWRGLFPIKANGNGQTNHQSTPAQHHCAGCGKPLHGAWVMSDDGRMHLDCKENRQ